MPKFKVITLGCKVNQYESAYIEETLIKKGWEKAEKDERVDLVIINTCIVTQRASHQSRQAIRKAIRENPDAEIVVTGCYAQVYPEELERIEGIGLIVGNKGKELIPELIKDIRSRKVFVEGFSKKEPFPLMRIEKFFEKSRAFLKIQDGCESFCSYCIVPYARGPYRSMEIRDVLSAIEDLAEKGYKEVVLTGIHLGKYGVDKGTSLEEFLREIVKNRYPLRIRLSSIEPNEITDGLIELISQEEMICNHFHIPLQSGDDEILRKMNRKYTRKQFYELVMKIYKKIPLVGIGTDVMVGFPTEDEKAYKNTVHLIEDLPITYLHVFPYSDRPNTKAFLFKEKVHPEIIKERAKRLREIGKKKRREFIERCIGHVFDVIMESEKKGVTGNYIKVLIKEDITPSEYIRVRIEGREGDFALANIL